MIQQEDKPTVVAWSEPPTMDPGAPRPAIRANGSLLCAYFTRPETMEEQVAVLKFDTVLQHRFGYPNDEALSGHPLYEFGLQPYGFFVVQNSPLIREIETQNRRHPQHRPGILENFSIG